MCIGEIISERLVQRVGSSIRSTLACTKTVLVALCMHGCISAPHLAILYTCILVIYQKAFRNISSHNFKWIAGIHAFVNFIMRSPMCQLNIKIPAIMPFVHNSYLYSGESERRLALQPTRCASGKNKWVGFNYK